MARPLDLNTRTDDITRAICWLLHTGGVEAVTMRAIAEAVGFSPGTLVNHLTDRTRILRVCAHRYARTRQLELDEQVRRLGLVGLLPQDDYDLWNARAWLAWCEIGRHAEGPAVAVARADEHEVWLLQRELGDRDAGVAAHALLRGLRESVAALGEHAMPLDVAQRIWAAHLASAQRGAGGPEAA